MYQSSFKGTHYEAGLRYGEMLRKNGIPPLIGVKISQERMRYAKEAIPVYEEFYPEILEEIRGISSGLGSEFMDMAGFLLSMYAFTFDNHCSNFAFISKNGPLFGRNSDFSTMVEELCQSAHYELNHSFSFIGNTTAWTEIEDGVNEHGLAAGLTFIWPLVVKPGFNAGMLVRYILEKCHTVSEAVEAMRRLPIGSAQTVTLLDRSGDMAVVECNCEKFTVRKPKEGENYIFTANHFISDEMQPYQYTGPDGIHSHERWEAMNNALSAGNGRDLTFARELLAGKYGFMCQYDRAEGMDTVWSSIFDLAGKKIYRVEGNPSRDNWIEDSRLKL